MDDDDEILDQLAEAGWTLKQLEAAAREPSRALGWLVHARAQDGVRSPAGFAWAGFASGSWPIVPPRVVVAEARVDPSRVCAECGETLGAGHLESCSLLARAAVVDAEPAAELEAQRSRMASGAAGLLRSIGGTS